MPIKIIGFAGLSSKDILLYCAFMICQCKQKVLVLELEQRMQRIEEIEAIRGMSIYPEGSRKIGQQEEDMELDRISATLPLIENYMGIDYLHFGMECYSILEDLSIEYDYILVDAFGLNDLKQHVACMGLFDMCEQLYLVTDIRKDNVETLIDTLNGMEKDWNIIYRNICNKSFGKSLFRHLYPECMNIGKEYEIWLDSYDLYYQMCIEYGTRQDYRMLSTDMRHCLTDILSSLDSFTGKQIKGALKALMKGGI